MALCCSQAHPWVSPADQLTAMESLSVMAQVDPIPEAGSIGIGSVTFSMSKAFGSLAGFEGDALVDVEGELKRSFSANATPGIHIHTSRRAGCCRAGAGLVGDIVKVLLEAVAIVEGLANRMAGSMVLTRGEAGGELPEPVASGEDSLGVIRLPDSGGRDLSIPWDPCR